MATVLLLFGGLGLGAAGTVVLVLDAARDSAGYITSPTLQVSSPTAAITAEDVEIQAGDVWIREVNEWGRVRLTATSPSDTPLFLGVAPQADVDRWLAGAAHDELASPYAGNEPRYQRATGTVRDLGSPATQTFWLASTSGTGSLVLDWKPANGRFAVVLARADGAQGVTANVTAATRIPDLTPLGLGLLAAGVLLIAGAVALIYIGAAGIGRHHATPPPPTTPSSARSASSAYGPPSARSS